MPSSDPTLEEMITSSLETAYTQLNSLWTAAVGEEPALGPLRDLPANLHQSIQEVYSRVTQGGTLPTLDDVRTSVNWAPPPPPPPAPVVRRSGASQLVHDYPYLTAFVATVAVGGTAYYLRPKETVALFRPVARRAERWVPLALLPPTNRPLRISIPAGEIRKEAVLVLGAEGVAAELALDLEARGFVVIATVSSPHLVDPLEKRSRGNLKTLVLDPTQASSVQPFLRSLSTALSLRFPLHSAGDPFARPSHALALTGVVNALELGQAGGAGALKPVEAVGTDEARREVGERVASLIGVLQGVLPILRTAAGRPNAPEGVILSLFPAQSSTLDLPFLSLASASAAASQSVLSSLKRELAATRDANLAVKSITIGHFGMPGAAAAEAVGPAALPTRLASVYAPALERRAWLSPSAGASRQGTKPAKLGKKVFGVLVRGRGSRQGTAGAGAFTYRLLSLLPHAFIDSFLSFQDRLAQLVLAHQARFGNRALAATPASSSPATSRPARPLSTPPAASAPHPDALRPGFAPPQQQPFADPFAQPHVQGHEEVPTSEEDESSVEDFGLAGSGMGSFVRVDGQDQ